MMKKDKTNGNYGAAKKNRLYDFFNCRWVTLFGILLLVCTENRWIKFFSMLPEGDVNFGTLVAPVCLTCVFVAYFVLGRLSDAFFHLKNIFCKFIQNAIGHDWLSLVFIFVFIFQCSWTGDVLWRFMSKTSWIGLAESAVLFIGTLSVVLIYPSVKKRVHDPDEYTILLSAMSQIGDFSIKGFLFPLAIYKNIDKIIIVRSGLSFSPRDNKMDIPIASVNGVPHQVTLHNGNDDEICESVNKLIQTYLGIDKNYDIVLSNVMDFNDFKSCYEEVGALLAKHEKRKGLTVVNTSPGTAAISGVMTVYAIKEKRQLTYNRQLPSSNTDNPNVAVDLDLFTIKEVMNELAEEMDRFTNDEQD